MNMPVRRHPIVNEVCIRSEKSNDELTPNNADESVTYGDDPYDQENGQSWADQAHEQQQQQQQRRRRSVNESWRTTVNIETDTLPSLKFVRTVAELIAAAEDEVDAATLRDHSVKLPVHRDTKGRRIRLLEGVSESG
jgi:hypothetical protein